MKLPGNMQGMLKQAQQMQEKMQAEVALIRVEASAGGGMVAVKMDGHKNVLGVKIDPEAASDVEMLQDMVWPRSMRPPRRSTTSRSRRWAACWAAWGCPRDCFKQCRISPSRWRA